MSDIDDYEKPRYTTRRLRYEIERATERLEARVKELEILLAHRDASFRLLKRKIQND